jgi:hypothetical protein
MEIELTAEHVGRGCMELAGSRRACIVDEAAGHKRTCRWTTYRIHNALFALVAALGVAGTLALLLPVVVTNTTAQPA